MKSHHALIASIALLAIGFLTGRKTAPASMEAEHAANVSLSDRVPRKIIRVERPASGSDEIQVSPTDIAGLLQLVDPQETFKTSTKLRAAFGDLSASALEDLLADLESADKTDPGFHTLRMSLLNHLVARDPFHAIEVVLAHPDLNFRNSSIAIAMQAAARLDRDAAKEALELIKEPAMKNAALSILSRAQPDASAEELLAILQEGGGTSVQYPTFYSHQNWGYNSWGGDPFSIYPMTVNTGTLAKLAQKDLSSAEQYARNLKTEGERTAALSQIAGALAQQDPRAALEWAKSIDSLEGRSQHIVTAITSMAAKNPQEAASLLGEIDNIQQRSSAISSIAAYWAQKDPDGAVAWLDSLPASQAKLNAYQSAAQRLGQTDPLAALNLMEKLPGNFRKSSLPNIINQWAAKDFDAAKNWITSQSDPITLNSGLTNFISTWAQRDPAEAAGFLEKAPLGPNQRNHFSTLAHQWSSTDRDAAMKWANSIENKEQRSYAINGVYQQWSNQDPADATRQLASVTDTNERNQLLTNIASNWINRDRDAAQNWLQSLPIEDRITASGSALSNLSYHQPEDAAALYDQLISVAGVDESQLRRFSSQASQIASQWGQHDPASAAEWAETIVREDDRSSAYQSVANQWVQYDPTATAQWIDGLPVGKPRDNATEALVQNVQQVDPASAFDWAETISDDNRRFNHLRSTLDQWKRIDPEGAREAVASTNVTPKQREQLLERIK